VLNYIYKFISGRQLKFSVVFLIVNFSIFGVGITNNKSTISPAIAANLSASKQRNEQNSILFRLRQIQEQRISPKQLTTPEKIAAVSLVNLVNSEIRPAVNLPNQDGTYLYSQSSEPNQIGQGYILFQKQQDKVLGALYMPQSELSCFQGTLNKSGEIAMTVTSSPTEYGATEVSTASTIPRFTDDEFITYAYSIILQDYHRLNSVSSHDKQILQMCHQLQTSS
jgi:hypothetical protein